MRVGLRACLDCLKGRGQVSMAWGGRGDLLEGGWLQVIVVQRMGACTYVIAQAGDGSGL